jgi:hypothetical protein
MQIHYAVNVCGYMSATCICVVIIFVRMCMKSVMLIGATLTRVGGPRNNNTHCDLLQNNVAHLPSTAVCFMKPSCFVHRYQTTRRNIP